jgi:hypothetical protein
MTSIFPDGKLHNRIVREIARAVWIDHDSRTIREQAFREGAIRDVLDGHGTPAFSQRDRDAITAAAGPILAGAES